MITEIKTSVNPEKFDRYYFPVNVSQVEDLLGKTLTQLEVMNLRNEKATKDVFRQLIWSWYGNVQENSLTSYQGCIAPIFSFSDHGEIVEGPQTNRWERICPNGCLQGMSEGSACSECPPYLESQTPDIAAAYDVETGESSERVATIYDATKQAEDLEQ